MSYKFFGNDNYGKPKSEYVNRIAKMSDDELLNETQNKIWLSAYANNNPRSDYHWQVDALWIECEKRTGDIYGRAYKIASSK